MAKTWAMILGWIILLVGILGFFSNPIISSTGYFAVDTIHNILHLLFGIILLWVAYGASANSSGALKTIGIIYLILAILGFLLISGSGKLLGFIMTNSADNWLNLVLGIVLVGVGMMGNKRMSAQSA
jgi:Domain of unknown function (DUF4383)